MSTEQIHARCAELGIDVGKKGDKALLEFIAVAEAVVATVKPVAKPDVRPERLNERRAQTQMANKYKKEKKVEIAISPMYANEFGNVMPISLNGVRIHIPCDGKVYPVPYSFSLEIRRRIHAVDVKTMRRKRMSNIQGNSEKSPGEIRLFR